MASKEEKAEEKTEAAEAKEESKEETKVEESGKKEGEENASKNNEEEESKEPAEKPTPATASEEQASQEPANDDDDRGKRVYVGNLAWEVSWQDLKDHMKSTGLEVARANVLTTPDGRSKGCGIVEFSTVEGAQQAVLTLNDTELKGRQIFVREDREDKGSGAAPTFAAHAGGGGHRFSSGEQAQGRRVYVGNLSWDVAWQDLKDHMRQAGEVVRAEVITEYSGRSKGCGIVEYATEEEAQEAISTLTDTELNGRMIFVREDRESTSQGGHPTVGRSQNASVYVWNLAPETSWQDLKDHMRKAGNVDSATIMKNAQEESIGCGVVVYQRPQDAQRAIRELQNSELHGKPMSLREDRAHTGRGGPGRGGSGRGRGRGRGGRVYGGFGGRGGVEDGTQLYVANLSFDTTWRELKDHFRQCGDVRRAEVMTGPGGQPKGFGTVQFFSKEDAEAAISRLNGSELQGRTLEVRLDQKAR